jgi:hypothetical protein
MKLFEQPLTLAPVLQLLLDDPRTDPAVNDNEAIRIATRYGNTEVVEALLRHPRTDPADDYYGAVMNSINYGHPDITALLLEHLSATTPDKYAVHNGALYVFYCTDTSQGNIAGYRCSIWCSDNYDADHAFISEYLDGAHSHKSAYSA